jgi:hypothetical protein
MPLYIITHARDPQEFLFQHFDILTYVEATIYQVSAPLFILLPCTYTGSTRRLPHPRLILHVT